MAQGRLRIEKHQSWGRGSEASPDVHFQMCVHVTRPGPQEQAGATTWQQSTVAWQDCLPWRGPHAAWWAQQLPGLLMACSEKWGRR